MYLLKLSSNISYTNTDGFHIITGTIGPFPSGDAAQAWFVKNFEWLDAEGVKEVVCDFMSMPRPLA